jgi:hypothetical protein
VNNKTFCLIAALVALAATSSAQQLPPADSELFCTAAQKFLSQTEREGTNTVFTDMPAYRASKPMVDPLTNYQVVSYRGSLPVVVSCKVKGSAHLRAAYGEDAAGDQRFCPELTRAVLAQAVEELRASDPAAAGRAAAFVVDELEPYMTGSSYLGDFQPAYVGDDGAVHLSSPGLFQDYDSWIRYLFPERVVGQVYCHLPTMDFIKALATGSIEPGLTLTTADDAQVTPD